MGTEAEQKLINLRDVIGIYGLCNTGSVLVYKIDYGGDRVLAGINDSEPEWCEIKDEYVEDHEELETGFVLGQLFIPFSEVMRFYEEEKD